MRNLEDKFPVLLSSPSSPLSLLINKLFLNRDKRDEGDKKSRLTLSLCHLLIPEHTGLEHP